MVVIFFIKICLKRKALQIMKSPKTEAEKPSFKKSTDARDAREVARKLIKSGAIAAIKKTIHKQDQTTFKRPKGQERKRTMVDRKVTTYQPFSSTQNDVAQETIISEIIKEEPRVQNLYQHFALERDREERGFGSDGEGNTDVAVGEKPRSGHTIFVSGQKVTEEFLKQTFVEFGTIVHVSMEIEKGYHTL